MKNRKFFIILIIFTFSLLSNTLPSAIAQISFEEVTDIAGISYNGSSWGSSWGDFNGDDLPDLWTGNHGKPKIYQNNGNGTFTDVTLQSGIDSIRLSDPHGASWADYDNDGDQDLLVLTGSDRGTGANAKIFLINNGNKFEDKAAELGLDYPLGRGRTPLWVDFDNDGLLDVIITNALRPDGQAPTALFHQTSSGFQDVTEELNFNIKKHAGSAQLSDLSGDGKMDIILATPEIQGVFDTGAQLKNIQKNLGLPELSSEDIVIADFDGDLDSDIFLVRMEKPKSVVVQDDQNTIKSMFTVMNSENGFSFKTDGDVSFELFPFEPNDIKVLIGADGIQKKNYNFTLLSNDQQNWGIFDHNSGKDSGIYIGYETNTQQWSVLQSSSGLSNSNIIVKTMMPIYDLTHILTEPSKKFQDDKLFIQTENGFKDKTSSAGLQNPTACISGVAGDFDNDMDLDLYLECTLNVKNLPNILYENHEMETFVKVPNAGNAEGSMLGIGDTVTVADYDQDGFLDLFLTNGLDLKPYSDDGPSQLFRNLGNKNNWIEIDLVGTVSNKDVIGARVYLTSGGVTQLREQTGQMHFASQNYQRLHFGLGENNFIEKIIVNWPSGLVSGEKDVETNQILQITEPEKPLPPKKQLFFGVKPLQVLCNNEMELIFKSQDGTPACVKPETAIVLIQRGWSISNT